MEIKNVPQNVARLIEKLEEQHFEGYVVGGCVRDSLLGIAPKDWDIATNATPTEMRKILVGNKTVTKNLYKSTQTCHNV